MAKKKREGQHQPGDLSDVMDAVLPEGGAVEKPVVHTGDTQALPPPPVEVTQPTLDPAIAQALAQEEERRRAREAEEANAAAKVAAEATTTAQMPPAEQEALAAAAKAEADEVELGRIEARERDLMERAEAGSVAAAAELEVHRRKLAGLPPVALHAKVVRGGRFVVAGHVTTLPTGSVVSTVTHDFGEVEKQGIVLAPCAAPEPTRGAYGEDTTGRRVTR